MKDANIVGANAAVRAAIAGFDSITDAEMAKVFISTGNIIPFKPMAIGTVQLSGQEN